MSAVDEIRERQEKRAQEIISMLSDPDKIDVQLWAKDQFEIGCATGRESSQADRVSDNRGSLAFGGCAGTVVIGLMTLSLGLVVYPWPFSPPEVTCAEPPACASKVSISWSSMDEYFQQAKIPGFRCYRDRRTEVFMCAPKPGNEAVELPGAIQ